MAPESVIATRIRAALAEHLKRDVSKVQLAGRSARRTSAWTRSP